MQKLRRTVATPSALVAVLLAAGCAGDAKEPVAPPPPPTVRSIAVTELVSLSLYPPRTGVYQAMARLSDGTDSNVTSAASWESSDLGVATITSPGRAAAVAIGSATIRAAFGGYASTVPVRIASDVDSIRLSGTSEYTFVTGSPVLQTGTFSVGVFPSTACCDAPAFTFSSSNPSVATVIGDEITAVGVGQANVRASYHGVTGALPVTVFGSDLSLTGTFTGTATIGAYEPDLPFSRTGPMSLVMTQTGTTLAGKYSGIWEQYLEDDSIPFAGTVIGATVTLTFPALFLGCPTTFAITITSATANRILGRFLKRGWCNGRTVSGPFALTRQ